MCFAEWGNINVYSSPASTEIHITLGAEMTTHMDLSHIWGHIHKGSK